jgi:hypothetical protein
MEANSEGFEAPKEAPKPSTEAPAGWAKEGNYTWKKDGWVVTEDTEGQLTASNPEVSGMIFGNSWEEIQSKIESGDTTPSIPKTATPEEIKAIAESPDGGITPSANDSIEPFGGNAPKEADANPTPADKPTEVPAAAKKKLLDDLANVAEQIFGKAPTKDALKSLLNSLKEQGGDSDVIDSALSDLDAPEPKILETPADKVAEDITQDIAESLTPEVAEKDLVTPKPLTSADIDSILSQPDESNPEIIWKKTKDDYNGSVLDNGHIVVHSVMHGDDRYDVVVRRNEDNSFSVYHRVTKADGTSKVYLLKKQSHSSKALNNSIAAQIYNANSNPNAVKKKLKPENDKTLLPTTYFATPTQSESFVSADGTILAKGMRVTVVNPTHSLFGQSGVITIAKREYDSKGYGYTDYLRFQPDGSTKSNNIVAKSLIPEGSTWKPGDPKKSAESVAPTGGTPSTPTPKSTTSTPTDSIKLPTYESPSIGSAKTVEEVEAVAISKKSDAFHAYFGADSYSKYKEFLKGKFVKDPETKNLVPGVIVSSLSPSDISKDPELASYGVIKSQQVSSGTAGTVEVQYFDGPLAGQTKSVPSSNIYSREKFLTNEQAKELGIDVDPTYRDEARKEAKALGEKYAKEMAEKKVKAEKAAAEAAVQAQKDAEIKKLKKKFAVNGPGFSLQTSEATADWSKSPIEDVPSLDTALKVVNGDDPLQAAKGVTVLTDSDGIEDLELRVSKVTDENGQEVIRVSFVMTDWTANPLVEKLIDDSNVSKSKSLKIQKYKKNADGSLVNDSDWENSSIDPYSAGVTYKGKAGNGTFRLHRATKDAAKANFFKDPKNSENPVAFHNMVEIILPKGATSADVDIALNELGGLPSVRPATQEDIKGLVENKMIWALGQGTDGTKNYAGELRIKALKDIEEKWGFTADDVEIRVDKSARGRISYLMPESSAQKIASETGVKQFTHTWQSSEPDAQGLFDMIMSGGLFATTNRWMEGLNTTGMSSKTDVRGNGGNYVFTHTSKSAPVSGTGSLVFSFDAVDLFRRLDYYANFGDGWGKLSSTEEDTIGKIKSGVGEVMFKKNISWADLSGMKLDSAKRKQLIELLTKSGNEVIDGIPIVDIIAKGGK